MSRRLRFVPMLFVVSLALSFALPARAGGPTGGIYVTTLPNGADVWVDGTYVGRSPVLIDALAQGHHALTLTKTGWNAQEVDVEVPSGSVAMSSTRLVPSSNPAGSRVGALVLRGATSAALSLDGLPLSGDLGKPMSLAAGTHHLTLTTPRGKSTSTVAVFPDMTTQVVLHDEPAGEGRSGVVAPAEDYLPDGSFALDGKRVTVRYAGHYVVARLGEPSLRYDGTTEVYDAAPETIGGKLYLPLELLEKLTADVPDKK